MKKFKKIAALMLAMVMVIGSTMTAFADNETEGETEKLTITITNTQPEDHTYEAYQVFKGDIATLNGKKVLTNIQWGSGVNSTTLLSALAGSNKLVTGTDEDAVFDFKTNMTAEEVADVLTQYLEKGDSDKIDEFAAIVGANLAEKATATSKGGTTDEETGVTTYKIEVEEEGYYFIKDQDESLEDDNGNALDNEAYTKYILKVVESVTIEAKSDVPTLDKAIVVGEEEKEANTASIGDTVTYKIKATVASNAAMYKNYYFTVNDTLSKGLTFDEIQSVTVGDNILEQSESEAEAEEEQGESEVEAEEETEDEKGDYTVTTKTIEEATQIVIDFDPQVLKEHAGKEVVVTYTATVNEDAEIGVYPNTNSAYLEFSNDPNNDEVKGQTPEDYVATYVTGIELVKVDTNNKRLTGAEFKLSGEAVNSVLVTTDTYVINPEGEYWGLIDGTYTTDNPNDLDNNSTLKGNYVTDNGEYVKYRRTITTTKETKTESFDVTETVGDDGVVRFDGLAEGTYTITEITAPTGYNLLKDDITVEILCDLPGEVASGKETATWSFDVTCANDSPKVSSTPSDGIIKITVTNKAGVELPSTGGMGTTILYVVGGILVVAAGVILITRKRMSHEA